jgi:phenylacetate-CoA ligase
MMSGADRLYARAPVWAQHLLVSTYGLRLRYLRYGPAQRAELALLRRSQWLTGAEMDELQLERLNAVLERARTHVPFYRERGDIPARPLRSLDELRTLPLLRKDDLRLHGATFAADDVDPASRVEIHTGGTTGKPLTVYCDRATLQRNFAHFERFKEWTGIRRGDRIATFGGRIVVPPTQSAPPFWRHNLANNALLLSSYHMSPATIGSYVERLVSFAPAMLEGYPSSLAPIARHIVEQGITTLRPRAVITSSETLEPSTRALFEQAFGCKVFDQYGSAEMAVFVGQCEHGRYHASPDFGVLELVREDGTPAPPGEVGEVVATGFINPVMPLIRYAMGDLAVRAAEPCPCGRAFPVLERVEGRRDDVLVTPDGRWVGRLDPVFKAVSSLYETRIVQDAVDHVRVETVVDGEFTVEQEAVLLHELQKRLGPLMQIDIARVPELPRTASGKLRAVVNLVGKQPAANAG